MLQAAEPSPQLLQTLSGLSYVLNRLSAVETNQFWVERARAVVMLREEFCLVPAATGVKAPRQGWQPAGVRKTFIIS